MSQICQWVYGNGNGVCHTPGTNFAIENKSSNPASLCSLHYLIWHSALSRNSSWSVEVITEDEYLTAKLLDG